MDLYEFIHWRLTVMPFVPMTFDTNVLKVGYCVAAMLTNLNLHKKYRKFSLTFTRWPGSEANNCKMVYYLQ